MDKKYKVLLVDDSLEWINSHKNMLLNLFQEDIFEIDIALSAREGFSKAIKISDKPYDLIISDLEMEYILDEDYAGAWLIKNIVNRPECKNTCFIIISGSYTIKDIAEDLDVEYIPKSQLVSNPLLLKYKITELLK